MVKKVLVVEDESSLALIIKNAIESWGYSTVVVSGGADAHELLIYKQPKQFCAVVSDMRMPRGSGLTLCQSLDREDEKNVPPMLIHSSDMSYRGDGVHLKSIEELKDVFDFVKVAHQKPKSNTDFNYIKTFLDDIR